MRIASSRLCTSISLLAMTLIAGCYRYEPIEAARPGMDVRARLSTEGAVRQSEGRDAPRMFVSGRVLESTHDSLTLAVLLARDPSIFRDVEVRETVRLSSAEVQSLMERRISTSRSLLLAGAVGVGGFLVVRGISSVIGGSEDGDPPPPQFGLSPADRAGRPAVRFRLDFPRR